MPDKKQMVAFAGVVLAVVVGTVISHKYVMPIMNSNKLTPPAPATV